MRDETELDRVAEIESRWRGVINGYPHGIVAYSRYGRRRELMEEHARHVAEMRRIQRARKSATFWLALLTLAALALLFCGGCARHNPLDSQLNAAFVALRQRNPWERVMLQHGLRSPSQIQRVDYYAGVSWLRVEQPPLLRMLPLGTWAQQGGGAALSRKEWLCQPALLPDLAGAAFVAAAGAAGVIIIMPAFQASEELIHAKDEAARPAFWAASAALIDAVTLRWLPWIGEPVSVALRYNTPLYFCDPREASAKLEKWLALSSAPNLHCPEAYAQWEQLCGLVALWQLQERDGWAVPGSPEHVARVQQVRGAVIIPERSRWFPCLWGGVLDREREPRPRWMPRLIW